MTLLRSALFLACALPALCAPAPKAFGKPLTLKEETRISAILENPEAYKGRRVKVRGVITQVCPERGCYLNLKGDKRFQNIMFKVEDGVIVFPANTLGLEAVAEGVVSVQTFSEAEQRDMCVVEARALNPKFDPDRIKGPMKVVRIDGIGAEIQRR